jgi:L,D-transpeptidase ErfK/SrfK
VLKYFNKEIKGNKMKKIKLDLLLFALFFVITAAKANMFANPIPGNDIIGQIYKVVVHAGDTVSDLRLKYELTYDQLIAANPNIENISAGSYLTLPARYILPSYRTGIVINIPELRLYYFTPDKHYVFTAPVCLGRDGWRTPTTITSIYNKEENPTWRVPTSIMAYSFAKNGKTLPAQIDGDSPDNPLGDYALYLANPPGYLIHGTNDPESIGRYFSSGCIRMQNDAVAILFNLIPVGVRVYIIHHPVKAGWEGDILYLEAHQPIDLGEEPNPLNSSDAQQAISAATIGKPAIVDWQRVESVVRAQTGIPTPIGIKLPV